MSNKHLQFLLLLCSFLFFSSFARAHPLDKALGEVLQQSGLNPQKISVVAANARTGETLAATNPELLMNPASCTKIVTTAAALSYLGENYRFETTFSSDRPPREGKIGTLYVEGNGDPFLVSEILWRMTRKLYHEGVREIEHGIVIDNSFFDVHAYPRQMEKSSRAYAAKTAPVAVNFNSVEIIVRGGTVPGGPAYLSVEPPNRYVELLNKVTTGKAFAVDFQHVELDGRERIIVTGQAPVNAPAKSVYRSIMDPSAYAGAVIVSLLEQSGIAVRGTARSGKRPSHAHPLLTEPSKPLALLIRDMNKFSNNFVAEQLTKHLGAVRKGKPGTTSKGVSVLEEFLASIGISKGSYTIENGSGLSDLTRLSAKQLVHVLVAAYRDFSQQADFVASLAILGVDGTMERWPQDPSLEGKLRAKTGTLGGVSSLAGYTPLPNGDIAAFAIVANGLKSGAYDARQLQLKIVAALTKAARGAP